MSQRNVERVIGRLVTDEAFRRRFAEDPAAVLSDASVCGLELTPCELRALGSIEPRAAARFAERIDPRLQKTDFHGGER